MCTSCGQSSCVAGSQCYEARLSIGLNAAKDSIIGSLDKLSFKPIYLKPAVEKLETNTTLKYDPQLRAIVFENEDYKKGKAAANYVSSQEILAGAQITELGGVDNFTDGGLASVKKVNDNLELAFEVPQPVQTGELANGFLAYVDEPAEGLNHYKLISPNEIDTSVSFLIGKPDGSIEFTPSIGQILIIPPSSMTSNGAFNGTPATVSGNWRYQEMGTSTVISNTFGSTVEVKLSFSWSMQSPGSRSGAYATLVNGGSDYKTVFAELINNVKRESYPGGFGEWVVSLAPNQKCQFKFGFWTNAPGTLKGTIGSVNEVAGVTTEVPYSALVSIRRFI